jgi:hypothetical protein
VVADALMGAVPVVVALPAIKRLDSLGEVQKVSAGHIDTLRGLNRTRWAAHSPLCSMLLGVSDLDLTEAELLRSRPAAMALLCSVLRASRSSYQGTCNTPIPRPS